MGKAFYRLPFMLLACIALGACATTQTSRGSVSQPIAVPEAPPATLQPLREPVISSLPAPPIGSEIVLRALGLIGQTYRFGGNDPDSGFDCSGLVRWVFEDKLPQQLPRSSLAMSQVDAPAVQRDELTPGDLVFFRTRGRSVSHVGIYIGEGRFVHAPRRGEQVRIDGINEPYWRSRFDSAKRVLDNAAAHAANEPRSGSANARGAAQRRTL